MQPGLDKDYTPTIGHHILAPDSGSPFGCCFVVHNEQDLDIGLWDLVGIGLAGRRSHYVQAALFQQVDLPAFGLLPAWVSYHRVYHPSLVEVLGYRTHLIRESFFVLLQRHWIVRMSLNPHSFLITGQVLSTPTE